LIGLHTLNTLPSLARDPFERPTDRNNKARRHLSVVQFKFVTSSWRGNFVDVYCIIKSLRFTIIIIAITYYVFGEGRRCTCNLDKRQSRSNQPAIVRLKQSAVELKMLQKYTLPFKILELTSSEISIARAYMEKFVQLSVEWRKKTKDEDKKTKKKKKKKSANLHPVKGSKSAATYETRAFRIQEPLNMYTLKVILSWIYELPDKVRGIFFPSKIDHLPGIEKELVRMYSATEVERGWNHEKHIECWCLFGCSDCENENSDCATSALRPLDGRNQGVWNSNGSVSGLYDSGFSGLDCENSSPLRCMQNAPPRLHPEMPPAAAAVLRDLMSNIKTKKAKKKHDTGPIDGDYKISLINKEEYERMKECGPRDGAMGHNKKAKTNEKVKQKRQAKLTPTHKGGEELNKLKFTSRSGRVTKRFALI